jgi:integrase
VPLSPIAVQILRLQKKGGGVSLIFRSATGNCTLSAEPLQPAVSADGGKAWAEGFQLARLRHATASLLDAAGVPLGTVQTLLGHTSSEVTREHYIHAVSSESRQIVGRIEELAIGPKWTQIGSACEKPEALAS